MSVRLSTVATGRDNNFNLIRFCAASGVFISHLYPLSGHGALPPAAVLGYVSVNVFFIISGFLVTKSLLDRGGLPRYFRSRILRIFPALIAAVVFSALVVGTAFTSLPAGDYLLHTDTLQYLLRNILLVLPDRPETLPGVFAGEPYSSVVNAPLWTLPYEVELYVLLALLGMPYIYRRTRWTFGMLALALLLLTGLGMALFVTKYSLRAEPVDLGISYDYFRFMAMFGSGALLYLFRDRVRLSTAACIVICVAILAATAYRPLFVTVTYVSLAYLVLYLAYVPGGLLRTFNSIGDYSYGIYIFGYPVQKSVEKLWPDLGIVTYAVASFTATLLLAMLSWHLIEKRALALKAR